VIKIVDVRKENEGVVLYGWVDGKEVIRKELTTREALNLIKNMADKLNG